MLSLRARYHIRGRRIRRALRRQTSRGRRAAERRVWQGIKAGRWDYDSAPWPSSVAETVDLWCFY